MAGGDVASVAALGEQDSPPDWLSDLPVHVLTAVLLCLSDAPEALLRLCACSRKLRDQVLLAVDVWKALCLRHGCAARGGAQEDSSFKVFCRWRTRLCRDCGVYTAYVFPLLQNRRLCEICESSPAYALITLAQALDFNLSEQQLATLPSKELGSGLLPAQQLKRLRACGQATLFLRSAVEALAVLEHSRTSRASAAKARTPGRADDDTQFELDDETDVARAPQCEASEEGCTTDGDDSDAGRRRLAKLTPEEAKSARKAAKAAVKAANRVRRAGKGMDAEPEGGRAKSWGASGASPLMDRVALGTSPGAPRGGGRDASRAARDGATWSRSYGTSPPVVSGPRARALVDDALGEFAISGLELCL
jgi:hypothetical protein